MAESLFELKNNPDNATEIRLQSLRLQNFKGVKSLEVVLESKNLSILGQNATGKTTVADGFFWLLFDKDSLGNANFEIKTLDKDGEPIHNLDHSVEAELTIRGQTLTLKKTYYEKWTKKRGSAKSSFTGHSTNHFIDGVPVQKKEYDAKIAEICDECLFRLLTDIREFNENLHWTDRRELLLDVCGDVSDQDVINSDEKLKALPEILGDRTLDEYKKIIEARRKEINKELDKIPVRIDEVDKGLPDISELEDMDVIEAQVKAKKELIESREKQKVRIEEGGEAAEIRKQIAEIESEILKLKNKKGSEVAVEREQKIDKLRTKIAELELEEGKLKREIDEKASTVEKHKRLISQLRDEFGTLEDKKSELHNQTFETDETCPTCGQDIPDQDIKEAKANFNQVRANQLKEYNTRQKEINQEGKEFKAKAETLEKEIADLKPKLATKQTEIKELEAQIKELRSEKPETKPDPEIEKLEKKRTNLEEELESIRESQEEKIEELEAEIVTLNKDIVDLQSDLNAYKQREKGESRIKELSEQEEKLGGEYEEIEAHIYLCEEFIKAKVSMLEAKINSKFELASFKLFNLLVNGGIEETCVTTHKGVPWGDLNHGARVNVGLDIIRTLQDHYGLHPPVIVDQAESITSLIEMPCQLIRLVVSAKDEKLRIQKGE